MRRGHDIMLLKVIIDYSLLSCLKTLKLTEKLITFTKYTFAQLKILNIFKNSELNIVVINWINNFASSLLAQDPSNFELKCEYYNFAKTWEWINLKGLVILSPVSFKCAQRSNVTLITVARLILWALRDQLDQHRYFKMHLSQIIYGV